jgi:hypothetical protein
MASLKTWPHHAGNDMTVSVGALSLTRFHS